MSWAQPSKDMQYIILDTRYSENLKENFHPFCKPVKDDKTSKV